MLRKYRNVKGMPIGATDGEIGRVIDMYFDDRQWTLRYLVVDTGGWLAGRKVLISPLAIHGVEWHAERIDVNLTREQVRNSPDIDTDKPVSRQHETAIYDYYSYPYYWTEPHIWGAMPTSEGTALPDRDLLQREAREHALHERQHWDTHLRSANAVTGYHIEATDGAIGHIDDFVIDPDSWAIRYVLVDTRNWLPGKQVLVAVSWIKRVSWDERAAYVDLSRDAIRESPEYDRQVEQVSDYEAQIGRHSGRNPAP